MLAIDALANVFSGALVGYGTNDIAIQMLFRKRLGLGGIFLKTRAEFIENISKLVERDIINHHTLSAELQTPEFDRALTGTVAGYFRTHLREQLPRTATLATVPGLAESLPQWGSFLESQLPTALRPLLAEALEHLKISDFLTPAQLEGLTEKLLQPVLQAAENQGIIRKFFPSFLAEQSRLRPASWLGDELLHPLTAQLLAPISELDQLIEDPHVKETFSESLNGVANWLKPEDLSKALAGTLMQAPLRTWVGEEEFQHFLSEVVQRLLQDFRGDVGNNLLSPLVDSLLSALEAEQRSLFELLDEGLTKNIRQFFNEEFPGIVLKVIQWLYSQQESLEQLVDATFSKHVESRFKGWLVQTFMGSVSQSTNLVTRLVEILDQYRRHPELIAKQITDEIVYFLENKSIGEIVQELRTQNPALGNELTRIVQQAVWQAVRKVPEKLSKELLDRPLNNLFSQETAEEFLSENIRRFLTKSIPQYVVKNKRSTLELVGSLQNEIHLQLERPLASWDLLSASEVLGQKSEYQIFNWLNHNNEKIAKYVLQALDGSFMERRLGSLMSASQVGKIAQAGGTFGAKTLHEIYGNFAPRPLQIYVRLLGRLPDLPIGIAYALKGQVESRLDVLLAGRIEEVVRQNLTRQSPDQIRDMVEKFMGKELKPITRLGGLLGGIAGGALTAMPEGGAAWLTYGAPALAYGVTGMGTNWVALKMIFKPYHPRKMPLVGGTVPFTPGVAIKNQGRFAQNMGKFVGEKLLNEEGLKITFEQEKERILEGIITQISTNNYATLTQFLQSHQRNLAEKGAATALKFLAPEKQAERWRILHKQIEKFSDFTLGAETDTSSLERRLSELLLRPENAKLFGNALPELANTLLSKYDNFEVLISPEQQKKLIAGLQKPVFSFLTPLAEELREEGLPKEWLDLLAPQMTFYKEKQLRELLPAHTQERLFAATAEYLNKQLSAENTQQRILAWLESELQKQVSPERKVAELFGGQLLQFVQQNLDSVFQNVLENALTWLKNNAYSLADRVYDRAFSEQKTAFLYKESIKNTVVDLASKGIPNFLRSESSSITQIVQGEVSQLGEVPLSRLGIRVKTDYLHELVPKVLHADEVQQQVEHLVPQLFNPLLDISLGRYLAVLGLHEPKDLQDRFSNLLDGLATHVATRYEESPDALWQAAQPFLQAVLQKILQEHSPKQLWESVPQHLVQQRLEELLRMVLQSEALVGPLQRLVAEVLREIKTKPLRETLAWDVLWGDVETVAERLLTEPAFQKQLRTELREFLQALLAVLPENILPETKMYALELLAKAGLDSVQTELPELLAALNLRKIVIQEIEKMPLEDIEGLFQSFASKYFDQLVRYGFSFGTAFGMGLHLLWGLAKKQMG